MFYECLFGLGVLKPHSDALEGQLWDEEEEHQTVKVLELRKSEHCPEDLNKLERLASGNSKYHPEIPEDFLNISELGMIQVHRCEESVTTQAMQKLVWLHFFLPFSNRDCSLR